MSQVNIGIIGFGTVGVGTFEALNTNQELISNRVGAKVVVKKIADLDLETDRGIFVDPNIMTTNAMELIDDPEIDIIVELMGGLEKAEEFIIKAMKNGKHVVTANKALLAEKGKKIYRAAIKYGTNISFEASVGGGIPIIGALKNGLSANRIKTIIGILNGTSNYILTRMTNEGLPYEQIVQEAVKLGFAEDPPTLDVNGTDAAHKLAIIVSIIFGVPVSFDQIYREGIDFITPDDIRFADEFGYKIKLLAIARDLGEDLEIRVHPAMISKHHILANVNDAYNAIFLEGDFVGPNLFYGLGAGKHPTGSAVAADIMNVARQIKLGAKNFIPPLAHAIQPKQDICIHSIDELTCAYYIRFSALDQPGALSRISGILGKHDISISSVIQKGRQINGSVSIVMLTHESWEIQVRNALEKMNGMEILTAKPVMIRVEQQ